MIPCFLTDTEQQATIIAQQEMIIAQKEMVTAQQETIGQQASDIIGIRHNMHVQSAATQKLTHRINVQSKLIQRLLKNRRVQFHETTIHVRTEKTPPAKSKPTSSILPKEVKEMSSIIHSFQKRASQNGY